MKKPGKTKFLYYNETDGSIPTFKGQVELDGHTYKVEASACGDVVWVIVNGVRYPNFQESDYQIPGYPAHLMKVDKDSSIDVRIWQRLWQILEDSMTGFIGSCDEELAAVVEYDDTQTDFDPVVIHLGGSLEAIGFYNVKEWKLAADKRTSNRKETE